jgi:hypothetical protein
MSDSDRSEPPADDGVASDAKPACTALVPIAGPAPSSPSSSQSLSRPNSTFIAHLIATAEHAPQTRLLRRATPADAQSAYSVTRHPVKASCVRTRQII